MFMLITDASTDVCSHLREFFDDSQSVVGHQVGRQHDAFLSAEFATSQPVRNGTRFSFR